MSTTQPQPGDPPTAKEQQDGQAPPGAEGESPEKKKSAWRWVAAAFAVVAIGLLVWGIKSQSDLNDAQQSNAAGGAVLGAMKSAYDNLEQQLGATSEDLDTAQADAESAQKTATQAQQDAAAAKQQADNAKTDTEKAAAEAEQAKADAKASDSKAKVATDCAKATVSSFGALFEGESVSEQASVVEKNLQTVAADCKDAFSGG